jgi:hypothetical protein
MLIPHWMRVVQFEDEGELPGRSPSQALSKLTARLGQRLKHFSHDNLILLNSLKQGEGGVLTPSCPTPDPQIPTMPNTWLAYSIFRRACGNNEKQRNPNKFNKRFLDRAELSKTFR